MMYHFRIQRAVPFLLIFTIVLMNLGAPARAEEAAGKLLEGAHREAFLNRLQEVQAGIRTFQADFSEERRLSALAKPLLFKGRLYYARDGLFFMEYQQPLRYILRVSGKEALFYIEGSPTADVMDVSGVKGLGNRPDLFGWDPVQFRGTVRKVAEGYRLDETASERGEGREGRRVTVLLDGTTLLVKQIWMADTPDDETRIRFSKVTVNQALPSAVRRFTLPKGTKLNRLNQP